MYFNKFSVRVVGGDEVSSGYVEMVHGQVYKLCLRNNRRVRCDAKVEIDGKDVGTWRIPAREAVTLERPAHDTGQFTFYEIGTPEARKAHLNVFSDDLGLVRVTFSPEKVRRVNQLTSIYEVHAYNTPQWSNTGAQFYGAEMGMSAEFGGEPIVACAGGGGTQSRAKSLNAGGTGLSGKSNQQFGTVGPIKYDMEQQTTINLRLVAIKDEPRPLTAHSNPVPPRI
jgi:hypothetical protein